MDMAFKSDNWTTKKLEIVLATMELVATEGFHGATTARIAAFAGVAEGTIYRHFRNKDTLIETVGQYAAARIMEHVLANYDPGRPAGDQFKIFCRDFLLSGKANRTAHYYLQHFIDSPAGIAYRRAMIKELAVNPKIRPLFYPLNVILAEAKKQGVVKNLPLQLLAGMTLGQLVFIVRDVAQGLLELNDDVIAALTRSCWDAIKKNEHILREE